jgi:hypothetical protein
MLTKTFRQRDQGRRISQGTISKAHSAEFIDILNEMRLGCSTKSIQRLQSLT